MSTISRLDRVYKEAERIRFHKGSRFVLMSDCHRGVGNFGDNFLDNSYLMFAALSHYWERHFTYIELGDGDELWENRNMKTIIQTHSHIFWQLSRFYIHGRFHMLYGNHDRVKEKRRFMKQSCEHYYCDSKDAMQELFPGMTAKEGLILEEEKTGNELFLVHGHQGDLLNDRLWRLTRFLVRHVWRKLELWGIQDPTSAAKNYTKKKKTEKRLSAWAEDNEVLLVTGHTHRPVLPKPGESYYFNDGSCVHPRCITALEIQDGSITLVKWCVEADKSGYLFVERDILEGPYKIEEYFKEKPAFLK